jgi:hypothetical protein
LHYHGQSIAGRSVPLDNLDVRLDIKDGQVTLHPLSFGVGKGHIATSVELTPQEAGTHAKADIQFQRVDVSRLMAATHAFQGAGAISGSGTIDAVGNSLAQLLDNGRGALTLAMVGGDLSAVLVDLSGLEFANALLSALGMPRRAQVECFMTEAALSHRAGNSLCELAPRSVSVSFSHSLRCCQRSSLGPGRITAATRSWRERSSNQAVSAGRVRQMLLTQPTPRAARDAAALHRQQVTREQNANLDTLAPREGRGAHAAGVGTSAIARG